MAGARGAAARDLAELAEDPGNPRSIGEVAAAGLGASLARFGDISGIVWNETTRQLATGHQRLARLRHAGARGWVLERPARGDLTPPDGAGEDGAGYVDHPDGRRFRVRVVRWTEATQRAANLTANNPEIGGIFTADALPQLADLALELPDFGDLGLEALLARLQREGLAQIGSKSGEDEVPTVPKVPVSRLGDLWLLGDHRLLCGDSTKPEDVARAMAGQQAVLMATDPPYGVEYDPTVRASAKSLEKVRGDDRVDWSAALAAGGAGVALVWFESLRATESCAAVVAAGFSVRSHIVWRKPYVQMARSGYHWQHENAWLAVRGDGPLPWYTNRKQTTVWDATPPGDPYGRGEPREGEHPTQKPVELFAIPMLNHTRIGELCYEPFCGSGTQIVAAEQHGRRCFALEIAPQYVDVAVRRWETFTGKQATLDGHGCTFGEIATARAVHP